jgi:hypothetical protein
MQWILGFSVLHVNVPLKLKTPQNNISGVKSSEIAGNGEKA